jgi:hypothetical protein
MQMSKPYPSNLLWIQSSWLEQANRWIDNELYQHGIQRLGAIAQPHIRHWSTVLRVPTSEGDIYFKAVIPNLAYEAALTQALYKLCLMTLEQSLTATTY